MAVCDVTVLLLTGSDCCDCCARQLCDVTVVLLTGSDCRAGQFVCPAGLNALCSRLFDVPHNTSAGTERL